MMVDDDLLEDGAYTKRGGQYDHYKTVLSLPKYLATHTAHEIVLSKRCLAQSTI